jgi:23S rRNA (uracil1939-C5)-methyltransferase
MPSGSPQNPTVTIESLSTDGRGVARIGGAACFVDRAYPGDSVRVAVDTASKPPSATVLELLQPSPDRVDHPCPHAAVCAGSLWGGLDYAHQLSAKRDLVERTLRKAIGPVEVLETVASPKPWNYRNRISLHVWENDGKVRAGFQTGPREQSGVAIAACSLADPSIVALLANFTHILLATKAQSLKPLPLRIQMHTTVSGSGMLLIFSEQNFKDGLRAWGTGLSTLPVPGGFWFATGTEAGILDHRRPILKTDHAELLKTVWLSQRVEIHPAAFTQANAAAANLVTKRLIAYAASNPAAHVWDLYGGFGGLGLAALPQGAKLTVAELSPHGEPVLQALAKSLNQGKPDFICGDLLKTLPRMAGSWSDRDLVILDPPRSGVHRDILRMIVNSKIRSMVYLSCNPAKLGRDLSVLMAGGFKTEEIQPYDFFPQTPSTEVLCILRRR